MPAFRGVKSQDTLVKWFYRHGIFPLVFVSSPRTEDGFHCDSIVIISYRYIVHDELMCRFRAESSQVDALQRRVLDRGAAFCR